MRNRIIFSDNGTLSDLTINLNNFHAGTETVAMVAAEDFLYIGRRFPFNHIFFKMNTANTNASTLTIQIWDGEEWDEAIDIIDETISSGATFGQTGYVQWSVHRNTVPIAEDTTNVDDTEQITGLGNVKIYDLYWIRLKVSADLSAGTSFSWIRNKFSDDNHLGSEYPDLLTSDSLTAFESGKTDWEEQHLLAAEIIEDDLINKFWMEDVSQVLDRFKLTRASVQKVAEIAFSAFGEDADDDRQKAQKEYQNRISKNTIIVDRNRNARVDDMDVERTQGLLIRG